MTFANRIDSSWKLAKLEDLVFFQRGFDISQAEQKEGDIPVISSSGVKSYHSEAKVQAPGVVIGRKGTLGSVHFTDKDYWPHSTTLWSKNLNGNNARYIYYFLKTLNLERFDVGNANPTLNRNHIHKLEIRIPSLKTQEAIADILSKYDDLIENNRRRIELLEESARLLYREWFVYFRFPGHEHTPIIDGIPQDWEIKKFDEVCQTIGGGTPSTTNVEYWDGDITWVVPTDVTRNKCLALLDSERKITEVGLKSSSAKMVPSETILMTSRASVGFFAMMDKEVCTNQGFINIIPNNENLRMFLVHNLMWRVEEIRSHAGGSTYTEISKTRFRNLDVLIPSKHLLDNFQEQAYLILKQVRLLNKQNQKLKEARDILLPRLMSGEIAV